MRNIALPQFRFTHGALNPEASGRGDLEFYYSTVNESRNLVGRPHGALKKRAGLKFLKDITVSGYDEGHVSMHEFAFSATQVYLVVFLDNVIKIFHDDIEVKEITSTGYSGERLLQLDTCQFGDTMIITEKDVQPKKLVRGATDSDWTLSNITFENVPLHEFSENDTYPGGTITPSAVEGTITLTASSSVLGGVIVGQYIIGNGGRARIVKKNSGTEVTAIVIAPFYNKNAIASGDWYITSGREPIFGSARGYPRTSTFHAGRLVLAGFRSAPEYYIFSVVNDYFNFDLGQSEDDDAIMASLPSERVATIYSTNSHNSLEFFTSEGQFTLSGDVILTPNSAENALHQSTDGVNAYPKPVDLPDGGTLFVPRDGGSIRQFIFSRDIFAYHAASITFMSSHLIKNCVGLARQKPSTETDGSYIYAINNDGSLVMGCIVVDQNVFCFLRQETQGKFQYIQAVGDQVYVAVQRDLSGTTKLFLEKFDASFCSDAAVHLTSDTAKTSWDVPAHLAGQICILKGIDPTQDNPSWEIFDPFVMPLSGQFSTPIPVTEVEVGFSFWTDLITNPVEIPQQGSSMGQKKSISELVLNLYNTQQVVVNSRTVLDEQYETDAFTGRKHLFAISGWDEKGQVRIEQYDSVPFELLNLNMKVSFGR